MRSLQVMMLGSDLTASSQLGKIEQLKKELDAKREELRKVQNKLDQYNEEKATLTKKTATLEDDKDKLEKLRETEATSNKNCTKILQQLEEYQKAYAIKERVFCFILLWSNDDNKSGIIKIVVRFESNPAVITR